jgi:hypothetical protein
MNCKQYQTWLADQVLGTLDDHRHAELKDHLAACVLCRAALERERLLFGAIDRGVAQTVAGEASAEMAVRIRQRVAADAAERQRTWRFNFRFWIPAAAVAVLLFVVSSHWLAQRRDNQRSAATQSLAHKEAPSFSSPGGSPVRSIGDIAAQRAARIEPPSKGGWANRNSVAGGAARRRHHPDQRALPAEPEVLVERDEPALVLELYNAARSGQVDGAPLVALPPGMKRDADGSVVSVPLEIPPLEIAQLRSGTEAKTENSR